MIFYETRGQAAAFLLLLHAGIISAVFYDVFSCLGRRAPAWVCAVLDICWALLSAALCALALSLGGENHLRLYALLGLCCGAGIYSLGVRALILSFVKRIKSRKK